MCVLAIYISVLIHFKKADLLKGDCLFLWITHHCLNFGKSPGDPAWGAQINTKNQETFCDGSDGRRLPSNPWGGRALVNRAGTFLLKHIANDSEG